MKMFSWSRTVLLSFMMAAECLAAAAQLVVVTSPTNDSSVVSPVHYVASASSPQCSRGIASMRIYIADHVVAYKVEAAAIDTLLTLVPGNYATVVQAWDN